MSDFTGDPTWDGGWEDADERGDSMEQWMLLQSRDSDDTGRRPGPPDGPHKIWPLYRPDND